MRRVPALRAATTAIVLGSALALLVSSCSQPDGVGAIPQQAPTTSVASEAPVPRPTDTTSPADARAAIRLALQAAEDRWRAAGISTYEHTFTPRCRCELDEQVGRVLGGRLIGPPAVLPGARTVEDWFDLIDAEVDRVDRITADFDDDNGVPLELSIDPDATVIGDEYGFETDDFRAVTDPVERWFTRSMTCGGTFAVATPDDTALISVTVADDPGPLDVAGSIEIADVPRATATFGRGLTADWCDDVEDPDQPETVVDETWDVTAGTIDVTPAAASVTGELSGLAVVTRAGTAVGLGEASYSGVAIDLPAGM